MAILSDLEVREAFHCVLLDHLPEDYRAPVTGVAPLRLKGGVNLRLFRASPRYSEDMDFDLSPARGPRFTQHLRRILTNSPPFRRHLLALGIQSVEVSDLETGEGGFKQKVRVVAGGVPYPTRVEATYQEETAPDEAVVKTIPEPYRGRYRLRAPIRLAAYPVATALWQKVLAISRRSVPQTRDVFDVDHLCRHVDAEAVAAAQALIGGRMQMDQVGVAAEAVLQFTEAQFRDQTVAYLPEIDRQTAMAEWPNTQHRVWEWLATVLEDIHASSAPRMGGSDAKE